MAPSGSTSSAGLAIDDRQFRRLVGEAMAELSPVWSAEPASDLGESDVAALSAVGADLTARRSREADPRAEAAAAGVALLASALSVADAATQLGVDPSRIRHRLAAGELLGMKRGRSWVLPAWQFAADGDVLPGLRAVAAVLRPLPAVVAAAFMATPQPELRAGGSDRSPRDWLISGGDPAQVVALAGALGEQF